MRDTIHPPQIHVIPSGYKTLLHGEHNFDQNAQNDFIDQDNHWTSRILKKRERENTVQQKSTCKPRIDRVFDGCNHVS